MSQHGSRSNNGHSRARRTAMPSESLQPTPTQHFLRGLARAFAGATIFSLPMLMTMEMWWLGFYMDPLRLALLLAVALPLLIRLSRYGGMRPTTSMWDDVADALVAIGIAAFASTLILWIFGVVTPGMPLREVAGTLLSRHSAAASGPCWPRTR